MRKFYSPDPWKEIAAETLRNGPMVFSREFDDGSPIPSPDSGGFFRKSIGTPKGQKMDWRAGIASTDKCVHILEFPDRYESHIDNYDPDIKPVHHLLFDAALGMALRIADSGLRFSSSSLIRLARLLVD